MAANWWTGLVGAGAGFALATARDELRRALDSRKRDRAVLAAMVEEVSATRAETDNNLALVRHELELLSEGHRLVNPLDRLSGGLWDLVKADPPRNVAIDDAALTAVRASPGSSIRSMG